MAEVSDGDGTVSGSTQLTVRDVTEPMGKLWFVRTPGMPGAIFDSDEKAQADAESKPGSEIQEGRSFRIKLPREMGLIMPKEVADNDFHLAQAVSKQLQRLSMEIIAAAAEDAPRIQVARPNAPPPKAGGPGGIRLVKG